MRRGPSGEFEAGPSFGGETPRAVVPHPLPPEPGVLTAELGDEIDAAHLALGRLDAVTALLPEPAFFLYSYIRKEAVVSSQIEGTRSTLTDLLIFELEETPGVPIDDVSQVLAYVRALERGMQLLGEGVPLGARILREVHAVLLGSGPRGDQTPGEFRRSQNWIGGTRPGRASFVPPPAHRVLDCMGALDAFLNDHPRKTPTLLKAGLAHAQFETIHPFLDGNGRVGRLLVTLLLCAERVLKEPLLYLSLYLKQNRSRYFELLQSVRDDGDWEQWLRFFLIGVHDTAKQANDCAQRLNKLFADDRRRIEGLGRPAGSALRVHHELKRHPILAIPECARRCGLSEPTVATVLRHLERLGLVRELTGRQRRLLFCYQAQLAILNEGVED
ncbi:MAG: Fic family protein [Planctomycetes bacterium]|nr:Fic family protein [Planctomycetota bacterium]